VVDADDRHRLVKKEDWIMTYLWRRHRGTLVLAALVALGVFLGGFAWLERAQGASRPGTVVLVAARDIGAGDTLTRDLVRAWEAPAGAPLGDTPALVTDLPRVLGRRVLAPILADEPIAQARLAGLGSNAVVAGSDLAHGDARYTLPVDPLAAPLPGLAVGDDVEVLAALPQDPASPDITATAQPVDPHARVVAVQASPAAVTLVVPRTELATLLWLRGRHATFSFATVGADDRSADMRGVGPREFARWYHVPSQ